MTQERMRTHKKRPKPTRISVVVPTLNEENSISHTIKDILRYTKGYKMEIIVADSSTDATPETAEIMGACVIKCLRSGAGYAIKAGLLHSKGDVTITTDCDGTYPLSEIPNLIEAYRNGSQNVKIVTGSRRAGWSNTMPVMNQFGNRLLSVLMRLVYGINLNDVTCGLRLYDGRFIRKAVRELQGNHGFWTEILIHAHLKGFKIKSIPICYFPRIGKTKLNPFKSGLAFLLTIIMYKLNIRFPRRLL